MVRHPFVYGPAAGEKDQDHKASCWLVNTGWTGAPYGKGSRNGSSTPGRSEAALSGSLEKTAMKTEPVCGLALPSECPGVACEILDPRGTWSSPSDYDAQGAKKLAVLFKENFVQFKEQSSKSVQEAGPR